MFVNRFDEFSKLFQKISKKNQENILKTHRKHMRNCWFSMFSSSHLNNIFKRLNDDLLNDHFFNQHREMFEILIVTFRYCQKWCDQLIMTWFALHFQRINQHVRFETFKKISFFNITKKLIVQSSRITICRSIKSLKNQQNFFVKCALRHTFYNFQIDL